MSSIAINGSVECAGRGASPARPVNIRVLNEAAGDICLEVVTVTSCLRGSRVFRAQPFRQEVVQMSPLPRRMIDDLSDRNMSPATQRSYLNVVSKFGRARAY